MYKVVQMQPQIEHFFRFFVVVVVFSLLWKVLEGAVGARTPQGGVFSRADIDFFKKVAQYGY